MNPNPRIDFHSNVADKLHYACRLVRKARAAKPQQRFFLLCANPAQMAQLDQLMWTFSDIDFVPHVPANHPLASQTPVLLSCQIIAMADAPHDGSAKNPAEKPMLINLSLQMIEQFAPFERIFEIVSSEEDDKLAGRARYRAYQNLACQLQHFVAQAQ